MCESAIYYYYYYSFTKQDAKRQRVRHVTVPLHYSMQLRNAVRENPLESPFFDKLCAKRRAVQISYVPAKRVCRVHDTPSTCS